MKPFCAALLFLVPGVARSQSYTFSQLDVPGATNSSAIAINNSGQILGSYSDGSASHCFLRSPDGATLTTFDPPGTNPTCNGLNNLGQVVGSFSDSAGFHGYIRDASGALTTFDIRANGAQASAAAINDAGAVVGAFSAPVYGGPGYLRSPDGAFTNLTANWIGQLDPTAINNRGEIAGWALFGSSQGAQHSFIRSADGVYRQFDLPSTPSYTRIAAINNNGTLAGSTVGQTGFVSNPDGSFTLLPDYPVSGLDDSGRIVGTHLVSTGARAFIGIPGPDSTAPEIGNGVLPAAAFGGGPTNRVIAPGSWIEIYGRNLAPRTRQWAPSDFVNSTAPTSLDGVRVTVGGVQAFISYISPSQVNALLPASIPPGSAQVVVTNGTAATAPYAVQVAASRPAMLSLPPGWSPQTAYIAAVFSDFLTYALPPSLGYPNVATRRPKAGDSIVLFGVGFGPVTPDVPIGRIADGPTSLNAPVAVTFARTATPVSGTVVYAGLMPGTIGLYQFNVVLPDIPLLPGETTDDFINVDVTVNGTHVATPLTLLMPFSR
jgi:uncharacterized protein (TIGR03437 family)